MPNNLFVHPHFGQAIAEEDAGLYYILNQHTGQVRSVLSLVCENQHWYLFQLQPIADGMDYRWSLMANDESPALTTATDKQIAHYFCKPEYAEPAGAWQVIRNRGVGFAKFTPMCQPHAVSFAVLRFDGEQMATPIRLHKAPADWCQEETAEVDWVPQPAMA